MPVSKGRLPGGGSRAPSFSSTTALSTPLNSEPPSTKGTPSDNPLSLRNDTPPGRPEPHKLKANEKTMTQRSNHRKSDPNPIIHVMRISDANSLVFSTLPKRIDGLQGTEEVMVGEAAQAEVVTREHRLPNAGHHKSTR